jgi:SAM-dependent methyltransferase
LPGDSSARDIRPRPLELLRDYWDEDSRTYDLWAEHGAWSAGERAAWAATLTRLLPPPGSRVLDAGAGTGFLSLAAARLGYRVTALDISPRMLARLHESATHAGLSIEIVEAPANEPPAGPFDAVMERLLLWTLPDPAAALAAWRDVAPGGRLIAFEGLMGVRDYVEGIKRRGRAKLRRLRRLPPAHHAPYSSELGKHLPLLQDPSPGKLIEVVEEAGWAPARLERLRDVEWARLLALPPLERLLGVTPEYAITAGQH